MAVMMRKPGTIPGTWDNSADVCDADVGLWMSIGWVPPVGYLDGLEKSKREEQLKKDTKKVKNASPDNISRQ